jgi:hypothetical protein
MDDHRDAVFRHAPQLDASVFDDKETMRAIPLMKGVPALLKRYSPAGRAGHRGKWFGQIKHNASL